MMKLAACSDMLGGPATHGAASQKRGPPSAWTQPKITLQVASSSLSLRKRVMEDGEHAHVGRRRRREPTDDDVVLGEGTGADERVHVHEQPADIAKALTPACSRRAAPTPS